jgi:prepilin-type processing-associated H-X9-DG protein/prepilin-type N-terminal cleavage/methylation domain-containing protein
MKTRRAFTLAELLVTLGIIAVLAAMMLAGLGRIRSVAQGAHCANSLRQLGAAAHMYLSDHEQRFFAYVQGTPDGTLWYFGLERNAGSSAEGSRDLDRTKAPLYPYVQTVGGIEVCPSFPYGSALWKPKFKGASWGYGFNTSLSNANVLTLDRPSRVILFGDCAQVNNFQPPASAKKPMIEEFYMIEQSFKTIHFRHGGLANLLFVDGHVEAMPLFPGTADTRLPDASVGRVAPVGSMELLR